MHGGNQGFSVIPLSDALRDELAASCATDGRDLPTIGGESLSNLRPQFVYSI